MAKTPLMSLFQKAYQIHKLSRQTGIPRDEIVDMAEAQDSSAVNLNLSRRQILYGGLGLASVMLTNNLMAGTTQTNAATPPVLIVGAGLAGLVAGYRLTQAGVTINIIEARNRVGGRVQTNLKALGTNMPLELGGEFIDSNHTALRNLAKELGVQEVDLKGKTSSLNLKADTYYFNGRKIGLGKIIEDFAPIARKIDADLLAIDNFVDYRTYDQATAKLDILSISEYLSNIPASGLIKELLKIAYVGEYGLNADRQSCLNLIYLIGTTPGTFAVFGLSDERYYFNGGNQQIPNKLASSLTNVIELNTILEGIRTLSDGRYRVSLRSGNSTFARTYERILLTLPFSLLRQVKLDVQMSPVKRLAIDTLSYGTNSKLAVSYQEAVWRSKYRSTGSILTDLPFQNTWEASASHYRAGTQGLLINFTGGTQGVNIGQGSAASQVEKFHSQVSQVFPELATKLVPNQVLRAYWYGQLYSQGSYACYRPGQWTRFYGVERVRIGNIFFAGEHCSLAFQGYMEGAVRTAEGATRQILQSLGLPLPPTNRSVDQEKLHPRRLLDTYPLN